MSYTKISAPAAPVTPEHIAALLAQMAIDVEGIGDELAAAGAYATLDSGQTVWCSCVVHDRPETPQIDFLVAAIEVLPTVGPRVKQNGQLVALATWRGVMPEHLDAWGVDTVRRACLMIALGESQPQVPIPVPAEGGPTEQDVFVLPAFDVANGSIRAHMTAADQIAAPLADVL